MITLSKFIDHATLEGLTTVFFNFQEKNGNFEVYSKYKKTDLSNIELNRNIYIKNNKLISEWSNLPFQWDKRQSHVCIITNSEKNLTPDQFLEIVYQKIQKKRLENYSDDDFEKIILLSLFGFRGSADLRANYYSVDIYRTVQSKLYLDYIFKLLTNISDIKQLNLNFRELQPDFTQNSVRRNTQIRINLKWFCEYIGYDLSFLNIYKDNIIKNQKISIQDKSVTENFTTGFLEKLIIYKDKVLNQVLYDHKLDELRKSLGINNSSEQEKINRSSSIVNIARALYDDECLCCKGEFTIEQRSFKMRKTGKYYLEIHHVISFASDRKGDQIDNLVKVCPACHKALTKNRAEETYQKHLIRNILLNSNSASEYVKIFVSNPTLDEMVNYIYNNLQ